MELSIQERLKDPRVERGLTLEQLAEQTHFSKSALGSYEAEYLKDISHYALIKLTKFYEVTNDYSEIPTSSHRRKLRRNKGVSKSQFPSQLKPFNDSLVLSLKSMIDKFPLTDTMTCYSSCFCEPYGISGTPLQIPLNRNSVLMTPTCVQSSCIL